MNLNEKTTVKVFQTTVYTIKVRDYTESLHWGEGKTHHFAIYKVNRGDKPSYVTGGVAGSFDDALSVAESSLQEQSATA